MATPETLTLSLTKPADVSGVLPSDVQLTLTLGTDHTPTAPAFTTEPAVSPPPAVPDDNDVPCQSFNALVSSCSKHASFLNLPLSAQAQCLCNVGPWDAVATACYAQLTEYGQVYATSITTAGLLGLCSTYKAGPTWPADLIASISSVVVAAAKTAGNGNSNDNGNSSTPTHGMVTETAPPNNAAPLGVWPSIGTQTWLTSLLWLLSWFLGV